MHNFCNVIFTDLDAVFVRQLLSEVLDSVRNTHPSIPGSKMDFILAVFNSPVELMSSQGENSILKYPGIAQLHARLH